MEAREAPQGVQQGPRLYRTVCDDFGRVERYLRLNPFAEESYTARARELDMDRYAGLRRRAVADALLDHNRRLGAGEPALNALRQLGRGEALAVVAAQTPALLTGPLFTIWKALTAVGLARRLEGDLGRPVVPLFWVAADDHDFHQFRQLHVLDRTGELQRLALDLAPPPRLTAGEIRLSPGEAVALWGRLERLVPAGNHLDDVRRLVRWRGLEEAASPVEWFSRILVGLLGEERLAVVDPRLPALRHYARSLMQQALVRRELMMRELRAASHRLRKHDYETVYQPEPGHTFMFLHQKGQRSALFWRDGTIQDRAGRLELPPHELARRLHANPGHFSPNAVLRAVLQDYLLPTLSVVAGPDEVVFYAQIRDVYPLFDLRLPVVHPRISLTLIEAEDQSAMRRYGLNVPRVLLGLEPVLEAELNRLAAVDLEQRFAHEARELRRRYAQLRKELAGVSPHLDALTQRNLEHVLAQLAYLERKARQHHRRTHRELVRTFRTLEERLHPRGHMQEDVLNIMPFLIRHGPRLLQAILREVPPGPHHHFVFLDPAQAMHEAAEGD